MKIFLAASYASKVNYETGEVFDDYKSQLEKVIQQIESLGHSVFCALRSDQYKINNESPEEAFTLDMEHIEKSVCLLALVENKVSTGVQTEIGIAIALKKKVIIAHKPEDELTYFNKAILKANKANELLLPLNNNELMKVLSEEKRT